MSTTPMLHWSVAFFTLYRSHSLTWWTPVVFSIVWPAVSSSLIVHTFPPTVTGWCCSYLEWSASTHHLGTHPLYYSSEHVWRPPSSCSPLHDCEVPAWWFIVILNAVITTLRVMRSQGKMCSGHGHLCVATFSQYCTDPDVTWGNGRGCPLVVHYWADLQLVHGFHCCDNIAPNVKCQRVLVLAVCLVRSLHHCSAWTVV